MPNPSIFFLTGLMLEFWRESDKAAHLRESDPISHAYACQTLAVIRAAKRANHEALMRFLRPYGPNQEAGPIDYPWMNDGGIEQ